MGLFDLFFKKNLNNQEAVDFLNKNAVIIDVRTVEEFEQNNIAGSKNIPLQKFEQRLPEIQKIKAPIILCCQSGMRSSRAYALLKQKREDCINGGNWQKVIL